MCSRRLLCRRLALLLFAFTPVTLALAQDTPSPDRHAAIRDEEHRLYADAQPYVDDSGFDLERKVPELKGLDTDSSEQDLSTLLLKVGTKVDDLIDKVPDLTSDEKVTQIEQAGLTQACGSHSPVAAAVRNGNCPSTSASRTQKEYHYIILSRQTPDGRILEESRTGAQDQAIVSTDQGPSFQGFVGAWIVFSPSNRAEAHFRYLGEQKLGKRKTFVIAFAQIPGAVTIPGMMVDHGRSIPMLFQGIAWVDEEDSRILQLRTDILAPQLEVGLQKQTARIVFGAVDISQLNLKLWLPMGVDVSVEDNGLIFEEQHVYSKYRMYHATARILPSAP